MGQDRIFEIVRKNAALVLAIQPSAISIEGRLVDLGANSIDRLEIVTMTMEALGLKFPLVELSEVDNIADLVSFLHEKVKNAA